MLTHLQIRDFAIIDLIELEVRAGSDRAHRRNRRGQIHRGRCARAARRRQGRRRGGSRGHRTRRALRDLRHQRHVPKTLRELLAEQSVEAEDELTVRRVIASDGRSRGYLNGVSVPLTLLRDVGALIVDIHGQHEFQSLTRTGAQRELLDDFGKHLDLAGQRARVAQDLARPGQSRRRTRGQGARSRFAHRTAAIPGQRAQGAGSQGRRSAAAQRGAHASLESRPPR